LRKDRGRSAPPRLGNPDRRPEASFRALNAGSPIEAGKPDRGREASAADAATSFHAPPIFRAFCERNLHFSNCRLEFSENLANRSFLRNPIRRFFIFSKRPISVFFANRKNNF
jgi:hypothetical protein